MTSPQLSQKRRSVRPLRQAALDFFFLQNRGYPRRAAIEWVGNRYQLDSLGRQLLHRGVFSQGDALRRLTKRNLGVSWKKEWLVVDGHNVQITVESALLGRHLLRANDGAVRDLAGQSAKFRLSEASEQALEFIFRLLKEFRPAGSLFLFDAPISQSGHLANLYQQRMDALGLPGTARAVPVPEREFPYEQGLVASSDQAVLENASRWVDLAGMVLSFNDSLELKEDFSSLMMTNMVWQDFSRVDWFS